MKPQFERLSKAQRRMPIMQTPILSMAQALELMEQRRKDVSAFQQAKRSGDKVAV